jgi:hypothetical protein
MNTKNTGQVETTWGQRLDNRYIQYLITQPVNGMALVIAVWVAAYSIMVRVPTALLFATAFCGVMKSLRLLTHCELLDEKLVRLQLRYDLAIQGSIPNHQP